MIRSSPWRSPPCSFSQLPENVVSIARRGSLFSIRTPWKQRRKMRRTPDNASPIMLRAAAASDPEAAAAVTASALQSTSIAITLPAVVAHSAFLRLGAIWDAIIPCSSARPPLVVAHSDKEPSLSWLSHPSSSCMADKTASSVMREINLELEDILDLLRSAASHKPASAPCAMEPPVSIPVWEVWSIA